MLMAIVPLGGMTAMLANRDEVRQQFEEALDQAKDGYRQTANVAATQRVNQRRLDAAGERMMELAKREREIRLRMRAILDTTANLQNRSDALLASGERMRFQMDSQKNNVAAFARSLYVRSLSDDTGPEAGRLLVRRLLGSSLGATVDEDLRAAALITIQRRVIAGMLQARDAGQLLRGKLHAAAGDLGEEMNALSEEREELLEEYADVVRDHDAAMRNISLSAAQLAAVQRETRQVQAEVIRMQSEMAQIDARLRSQAERELIQMGLREARPGRYKEAHPTGLGGFVWPARGSISAGFHDSPYLKYFGVPHQGVDIVVGFGTPVVSVADGIVFLARDGGELGYSYILVGHRDGYATLSGHLSSFAVATGQQVAQGQVIGYSGGTPGTHGAGPMTTGAHLHFEVLKGGVHINPRTVLP